MKFWFMNLICVKLLFLPTWQFREKINEYLSPENERGYTYKALSTYLQFQTMMLKKFFSLYLLTTYYYTDGVLGAIKLHCSLMS